MLTLNSNSKVGTKLNSHVPLLWTAYFCHDSPTAVHHHNVTSPIVSTFILHTQPADLISTCTRQRHNCISQQICSQCSHVTPQIIHNLTISDYMSIKCICKISKKRKKFIPLLQYRGSYARDINRTSIEITQPHAVLATTKIFFNKTCIKHLNKTNFFFDVEICLNVLWHLPRIPRNMQRTTAVRDLHDVLSIK